MYYGKKAALLLDGHRRAMKREEQSLVKLLEKSDVTTDELSQQIKKLRALERESLEDSIIVFRTMTRYVFRLNLKANTEVLRASRRLTNAWREIDGPLMKLEDHIQAKSAR